MTREEIKEILESDSETGEKITQILNKHHAKVDELSTELETEKLKAESAESQLSETKKTLKAIKKETEDNASLQEKLTALEETNKGLEERLKTERISSQVELSITRSGVKNAKLASMIQKSLDMTTIAFDDEGKLTGLDEQLKALKEDADTASLFGTDQPPKQEDGRLQAYAPVKGDDVKQTKTQGALLGEQIKAQRERVNSFEQLTKKGA